MTDVWFVVAGYAVILGGLATYTVTLLVRLRETRAAADRGPAPRSVSSQTGLGDRDVPGQPGDPAPG